jgi:1-deoxy-D-xylulose-5-phosphate synthase
MVPKDGNELKDMLFTAVEWNGSPVAIRYPRGSIPDQVKDGFNLLEIGKWEILNQGDDLLILACGSMVYPALEAEADLKKQGIKIQVVNCRFVKPLDEEMLASELSRFDKVITVEENSLQGGFGSAVLEFAQANNFNNLSIKRLGIPDRFIEHGARKILLAELGLDQQGISKIVKQMIGSNLFKSKH